MELPASYVLALQADQRRMEGARLDTPAEQTTDRRRSIRTAFRLAADVAARFRRRRDASQPRAQASHPASTPNASRA